MTPGAKRRLSKQSARAEIQIDHWRCPGKGFLHVVVAFLNCASCPWSVAVRTNTGASRRDREAERSNGQCGCSPPAGCACGGAVAGWACASERACLVNWLAVVVRAALRSSKASSTAHPAAAPTQVCPFAQRRGRRLGVAFLLGTFLWRSKEQVPRPPGRVPASALNTSMLFEPACPGFDRLSPNGRGWAASRLRQAQPKWLGITPFAINSIAASAYLISARAIKHIKTQRPAP